MARDHVGTFSVKTYRETQSSKAEAELSSQKSQTLLSIQLLLLSCPCRRSGSPSVAMVGGGGAAAVPESVLEPVNRSLQNIEQLEPNLLEFMANFDPDALSEMAPLSRAHALFVLAKATSTLFTLWLRCRGIEPDDHPVKTETERLRLYEAKLERFNGWSKEPLRPSTTINYQAATRFIEHSLPDLTAEQRQSLRDISRGEGHKSSFHENQSGCKKRKHPLKHQSVAEAAREFLEKAQRELLGAESDVRGPLRSQSSDEEDVLTS